jgi:hypothetical protein
MTEQSATSRSGGAVGSDPKEAAKIGGKGDLGVPETGHERDRAYVSQETKSQDPGARPGHSGTEGQRVAGVGGNDSGIGSSSGGDVDTDIIGVGAGGSSISQSGPDERREGKDMVGGDAQSQIHHRRSKLTPTDQPPPGAFVQYAREDDESTTGDGQGAAAVTNPDERNDDSFMGELSNDDVSGADNTRADRM